MERAPSQPNPSVDGYVRKNKAWHDALTALRRIAVDCGLTEEVKWRVPCYTYGTANIAFLGVMKQSCVISFVKGALLKDPAGVLIQQTENSQSVRVIRFKTVDEIRALGPTLKAYLLEAVAAEKAGLKVPMKTTDQFKMPDEFRERLESDPDLAAAFDGLTPGRQRGYLLHFAGAKQSKTRAARVAKWTPHILDGKGIDDD